MPTDAAPAQPLTGVAADVPFLAIPPAIGTDTAAPLVICLHAFEPPRSEAALAGTLPLAALPAWRCYLGLPMFGERLPEGGVAEINRLGQADYLLRLFGPVVDRAAAELPAAIAELRRRLPVADGPVGIMGVGAGGAAALLALLETDLDIGAMGVVNAIVSPTPVIEARDRRLGTGYAWTDDARKAVAWLDLTARAGELAARAQPPLLIATGEHDDVIAPDLGADLYAALEPHYRPGALRHLVVPDLGHAMGPEPGLAPGPPAPGNVLADRALTEWFHLHLTSATEDTMKFSR
ncbi:prolyl oligopeptidase family serine peptidase [Murinocardiopsis flavida]|uniref:prolyl oligopeptidase family serine peptidase n=1 Tax=Murinocardiopsis flavida TaxID=645275 RepID=UPI0037447B5C